MIKQIISKYEAVQTRLVVDVDGVRVTYSRDPFKFMYTFSVDGVYDDRKDPSLLEPWDICSRTAAVKAVEEVINELIWQSEDHGARWAVKSRSMDYRSETEELIIVVEFRVRDAG